MLLNKWGDFMLDFLFNVFNKASNSGFWFILLCIACLGVGLVLLIKGADFFVSSASTLAKKIGVSSLIIGLTVVSIGTSLPEASVSISSALRGSSELSIGNVVGSNIFNILVVLGCSCIFAPIIVDKGLKVRDLPILIGTGLLLLIFTLWFNKTGNYDILRFEAIILLVLFISYIILCIFTTKKKEEDEEEEEKPKMKVWLCILIIVVSGFAIACGGEFVTYGAKNIAVKMGADEILVGLTIVAVGTSLPELVTSIMAAKKHENDIAVGNAVGSSIFNILFILGAAATISPYYSVDPNVIWDIVIMLSIFILTAILVFTCKKLGKAVGIPFVILYVAYLAYIIIRNYCF